MKIARGRLNGIETYGFVVGDTFVDHSAVGVEAATVREFIAHGGRIPSGIDAAPSVPLSALELDVPIELDKVLCAGVNFQTHRDEAALAAERPPYPLIFTKFPDAHVGHGSALVKPRESEKFDYEGELAVVIGKPGRRIPVAEAMDHVFGYSAYNDGSARDWQMHTPQWTPGKTFHASSSMGPYLVSVDEIPDVAAAVLETKVNGQIRQRARIAEMIFSIAELIAYVSVFTPLAPGDVIAAGTPGGVGLFKEPPTFLVDGDVVEVSVDGVGELRNAVREG